MINNKEVTPTFERNPLPTTKVFPWDYDELAHSDEIRFNGSVFQGHAAFVHSVKDAVRAKDALLHSRLTCFLS